jgi:hypothetical protein
MRLERASFGCRWSRVRRGDDIVFIFKGDKGDDAANLFALACEQLGIPRRAKQQERLTGTQTAAAMSVLILKRASSSASRPSGEWRDDDYDVLEGGTVVGRIFKVPTAPEGRPWMWILTYGYHEDRIPTHGYEATREAAMAAFAKSWRRR